MTSLYHSFLYSSSRLVHGDFLLRMLFLPKIDNPGNDEGGDRRARVTTECTNNVYTKYRL